MKYELPSTELIVIEENNYLKFGEYSNDMQCDDTVNKLNLDDLEYVKKLQQENKQLKGNWNKLKEWASNFYNSEEVGWAGCGMRYTLEKMQEIEGSD